MIRFLPLALALGACSMLGTTLDQGDDLSHRPAVAGIVERLEGYEGPTADAARFLAAFDVPEVDAAAIYPDASAVIARHDAAVLADEALTMIEKRAHLLVSENVRRTLARVARIE